MNEQKISELERRIEELQRIIKSVGDDERKYREMVEYANSIIINIDRQGRFTYINDYAERFFGYTKSELLGKKVVGTIFQQREFSEKDMEALVDRISQNPDEFKNYEKENITKDGRKVWISWTYKGIYDAKGRLTGIISIGNDVTPLKNLENILREAKEEWESIFDALSDWICLIDTYRTIIRSNIAGERFLNLPMENILGRTCCMLIHGSDTPIKHCPLETMLKTKKRERMDVRLKDESVWLEITVDPVIGDNGNITGAVHIVRDITPEKNVEKALRESEEKYRTLVDTAEEGVWVIDTKANTTFVNRKMAQMLGYTAEEMMGHSLFEFMDDEMRKLADMYFENRKKGIREQHDFRFTKKDGNNLWAIVNTNPLFDDIGNFIGALAMITDITERKLMEETIEASREKLRALATHLESVREEERTRIAREIHDELGQALTCIKIDLSEVRNDLETDKFDRGAVSEKTRAILSYIDETINTVRKISAELRPSVLDDLGITAAIQWLSQDFHRRTGILCNLRRVENITPKKAVETALFRILQESLTNVVRHSGASLVTIDFFTEGNDIILSVHDNGKGFEEVSFDITNSLGLLGIKERVLPFKGDAGILSQPGKGTLVTVKIPKGE